MRNDQIAPAARRDVAESHRLPAGYAEVAAAARESVRAARVRASPRVSSELVGLYLRLGRVIIDR